MLRAITLASILIIGFVAHAQSREETTALVEGHVFNMRTGTPIRGALVSPIPSPALEGTLTDENGFFSLEVDLEVFDSLIAQCRFRSRRDGESIHSSTSSLPAFAVPYLRRDFYLDIQRSKTQVSCLPPVA